MEEIKIWAIDGSGAVADLEPAGQTETENLLEDALVNRPDLLLEDLVLVGRQTQTEGGRLDLLGVDGDGRLAVFELKRETLHRDAVAQVIDYASSLDSMNLVALAEYISEKSSQHDDIDTIEDFEDWYSQYSEDLESLKPLRMVLVGLGVDPDAERMVKFLAESVGMDMSLITFHGFNHDGKTILAKQVEVEGRGNIDNRSGSRKLTMEQRRASLNSLVREFGVEGLFDSVTEMFKENWPESTHIPTAKGIGLSIRLPGRSGHRGDNPAYVGIYPKKGGEVVIAFYQKAVELSEDAFSQPIEAVPCERDPSNPNLLENIGTRTDFPKTAFPLTSEMWEIDKEQLTALVKSLYEAWQGESSGE